MYNRYENFPRRHVTITPHNTNKLDKPYIIVAGTDGNIAAVDDTGVEVVYAVTAGSVLPIMPEIIKATGTTVTQVIGVY